MANVPAEEGALHSSTLVEREFVLTASGGPDNPADMEVERIWEIYAPGRDYVAYRIRKIWWTAWSGVAPHWVYSVTKMSGWPDASHFSKLKTARQFVAEEIEKRYN